MTDDEICMMQKIRAAAGVEHKTMLSDMPTVIANMKKNADRYEKIRRLTPLQFECIYQRSLLFDVPFDQLIDSVIIDLLYTIQHYSTQAIIENKIDALELLETCEYNPMFSESARATFSRIRQAVAQMDDAA